MGKMFSCSVTDFSGHSVSYTVYYRERYDIDDKFYSGNWTVVVNGLTETEFKWDTSKLRDDALFSLKVVAECSERLTSEFTATAGSKPWRSPGWSFAMVALTLCLLVFASRRKRSK